MPWQPTLRDWARRIKFDGVALWVACSHAQAPWWAKLLAVVTYALTPVDLIPDVISVPGYLDDVLLPGLIWLTVRLSPPVGCHSRLGWGWGRTGWHRTVPPTELQGGIS